jgi:hypothetical protein
MEFIGILFSLFFAIILTALFSLVFKNTGPWGGFWIFFILLFFIALGAGEWAAPRGPAIWGYYWAPGLIAAIIFALLLAAAGAASSSSENRSKSTDAEKIDEEEEVVITTVIGVFFWVLIGILAIIALTGLAIKII